MCNCIKEITEKFLRVNPDYEAIEFNTIEAYSGQLSMPVRVKKKGEKFFEDTNMFLTYCPFCAEKYDRKKRLD